MICCNERYPLLLKCFICFLRCISKARGCGDRTKKPPIFHIIPYLLRVTLKLHANCQISGRLSKRKRGVIYNKEGYILPLNYSITFLRYIHMVSGPTDSIYKHIMCQTVIFLSKLIRAAASAGQASVAVVAAGRAATPAAAAAAALCAAA